MTLLLASAGLLNKTMKRRKGKLFEATAREGQDNQLVQMPGFSHRSEPKDGRIKFYFYAEHRRHAAQQIVIAGIAEVRDLDGGIATNIPDCIKLD
jgi:rhodanese-related sulfurtransferase